MTYLLLAFEFFKVGLFAVGGGLATLPFLSDLCDKYTWFTRAQLSDMIAVSESTPGAIGVNMATYAGINAGGILGGIVATLSLVAPSIIVILIVAKILEKFKTNFYVKAVFQGLRPAVTALIASAGLDVLKLSVINTGFTDAKSFFNAPQLALFLALFLFADKFKKLHPIVMILIAAIAGVVFGL